MEKAYKYTVSELHVFLRKVCETDKQKLKYKVVQDLQFYFELTENEAVTIWNESVEQGILKHYNTWETVENEANTIWNDAILKHNNTWETVKNETNTIWNDAILKHNNTWETDEKFKTYSYDGIGLTDNVITVSENDFTDKGMSNTYHNTKTAESLKHGRYGRDRIDSPKNPKQRL